MGLNSMLELPAPQLSVMPLTHAELARPAQEPPTQEPPPPPNHALLPSLDSMLELPAPQLSVMPLTHAELARPAQEPPTQEPLPPPNHALLPSLKSSSLPVVSAPHQLKVLPPHALLTTNAMVPRKPDPLLVPRHAKPYE